MPNGTAERELSMGIDHLVEHMNAVYGAVSEDGMVSRGVSDGKLRDDLIEWIENIVRCAKMSEFSKEALLRERVYRVELFVTAGGLKGRLLQ